MSIPDTEQEFELLLEYLKRSRGFDFSGYKPASLMRRIQKRMQAAGTQTYGDYIDYLEVHPDEFTYLFNTILINVTSFFRDADNWEYLSAQIVPRILGAKQADDPVRVWSAGCASGEEAYSAAIVLAEALGEEAFRSRVKIYASDVDEEALSQARQAAYSTKHVAGIPPTLLEKYFEHIDSQYIFRKDLRRSVIFGRHDLMQDAPISRIDLLICRNALMYFNSETQARILNRFHFGLSAGGFLFLGKAEMLFTHAGLFVPVDLKRRIFTKVPKSDLRERLLPPVRGNEEIAPGVTRFVRFREAALDSGPVVQIVTDLNGFLALANERARALFGLTARDSNRPLQDLAFYYRLEGLRAAIEQANAERRPVNLKEVEWQSISGEMHVLDVHIVPLLDSNGVLLGQSIAFLDVTRAKQLQEELEHANQALETAHEELQSTNEELETTNEELQSTIEELETTNEELQSTNEELETMNEELQSTNEELQTMNEELRHRTDAFNRANSFLESILSSLRGAVVVLDNDLSIQSWNRQAENLWGLRPAEVQEKNFLNLDIGLPVDQLKQNIRACLNGEQPYQELILDATNRRGKPIQCRVTVTHLEGTRPDTHGVIMTMEEIGSSELQEGRKV